jgi:tetratricopeptide (TPR) repeat protein
VIVTSRNSLAGLVARDGARRLDLDLLPLDDAVALLGELIGDRAAANPGAVAKLAEQCARLPLALRLAAERAAARPHAALADLSAELGDQQQRLDSLSADDDPRTAVRAVFSWSYRQLTAEASRLFRLLGLHPGPDISVLSAASLAAVDRPQARGLLSEISRAHLIAEHVPGRYAFHDLLRAYAAEQARAGHNQDERNAAIGRVLDYYLHTVTLGSVKLNPRVPVTIAPARQGTAPEQLSDHQQALAWFDAEYQVLLAAVALAENAGFDAHAWQLPWAMTPFLNNRGQSQDWAAVQRTALAAATRLGDAAGQAVSARLLAAACTDLRDHEQAVAHLATSLALYQRLGDQHGEAQTHQQLTYLAEQRGHYPDALRHSEQVLRLYQAVGDKVREAVALNNVGWCHALVGDYERARTYCRQALTVCAEAGDRGNEGYAWDSLGFAEHHLGNLRESAACYERALAIKREFGDRSSQADTLNRLGDTHQAAADLAQAQDAWRQALAILDDLSHPGADAVRAKLAAQVT